MGRSAPVHLLVPDPAGIAGRPGRLLAALLLGAVPVLAPRRSPAPSRPASPRRRIRRPRPGCGRLAAMDAAGRER